MQEKKWMFIFTGPDGSGRKTVAHMVGISVPMERVLSYTTRPRKPIEVEGQDYYFVSRDEFLRAEQAGEFVESVEIDGELYGIKWNDITRLQQKFPCIYVVLNCHGADLLKEKFKDAAVRIFLYADRETLIQRQRMRGDSEEDIARHMVHYEEEMQNLNRCEHAFENKDAVETAYHVMKVVEQYLQRNLIETDD